MSDTGLIVPGMYQPLIRYNVTITLSREDGQRPDPVTFAAAASQAAWRRSASIVGAHTTDTIISVITVEAPGRYAAAAIARAIVSDALQHQAPAPSQPTGDTGRRARAQRASAA